MPFKMMPKWGHWFWITAVMLQFSAPIPVLSIGRGGFDRDLNTGVSLSEPPPFPVFAGPQIAHGPLTIVTPSTVVRYHGVEPSIRQNRQNAGFARRLDDELPLLAKNIQQPVPVDKGDQTDPGDVSVSKSVRVVSVKYSFSGERRRQNQTQDVEEAEQEAPKERAASLFDTTTTTTTKPSAVYVNKITDVPLINPTRPSFSYSSTTTTIRTTTEKTSTTTTTTTTTFSTTTTSTTTTTTTSASTSSTTETTISPRISSVNDAKLNVTEPIGEKLKDSPKVIETPFVNDELFISEVSPSGVRGDKSLFASTENIKYAQQQNVHVSSAWPSPTSSSPTTLKEKSEPFTSTYRPSPRSFPEDLSLDTPREVNRTSTEKTTTSTTIDFLATPTRVFLQEVEVISDDESDKKDDESILTQQDDQRSLNPGKNSSDSNGKMIVEYLEDAELARSFPSTKWNVYEDNDGTWYLQKNSQQISKESGGVVETKPKENSSRPTDVEYDELPKVVDVAEGAGLTLFDGGESDRDEEPYEKFMAEESGRSSSDVVSPNEEYTDNSNDDDLLPSYDERNFEEEIVAEPRMLSTAQKPSNDGFVREHLRDGDGQPQRRKPMTIDVTTVVGITVGAFLFILIGTVGLGAFIYHEKYVNKPQTLEDRYSSTDSDGSSVDDPYRRITHIDCVGFDTTRDTFCEEMYNLDNDSFLNSLETVNAPSSYWIQDSRHSDSDV